MTWPLSHSTGSFLARFGLPALHSHGYFFGCHSPSRPCFALAIGSRPHPVCASSNPRSSLCVLCPARTLPAPPGLCAVHILPGPCSVRSVPCPSVPNSAHSLPGLSPSGLFSLLSVPHLVSTPSSSASGLLFHSCSLSP